MVWQTWNTSGIRSCSRHLIDQSDAAHELRPDSFLDELSPDSNLYYCASYSYIHFDIINLRTSSLSARHAFYHFLPAVRIHLRP